MKFLSVEDIILQHSHRGMEKLRPCLSQDFCGRAAAALLAAERGTVLIATGFYVGGAAETDGPPGAFFLARALRACGFHAVIVTDRFCEGLFDEIPTEIVPLSVSPAECAALLDRYGPTALIAVERCGVNARGDYANMRGVSIAAHTARLDPLFLAARQRGILTVGVGDGGNEIGMGCFREVIERELSLCPCVTEVDYPIIATVSNWGAYGLCACLQRLSGRPVLPGAEAEQAYLRKMVRLGCVDGVTGCHTPTADGFPCDVGRHILEQLAQ